MISDLHVIVGLGITGVSCARYLKERGVPIAVTDTRPNPPALAAFQATYPDVSLALGGLDAALLAKASRIVLSPGISLHEPAIAAQLKRGTPVIGDIELFAEALTMPVIAITGTNAKSTVTTLVGKMAEAAGLHVQVGGNLGVPALDLLLQNPTANVFVLELSSFQLETMFSLKPSVATVLNVTPDHMDRYHTFEEYQQAKHRVYQQADTIICNRDDVLTYPKHTPARQFSFTLDVPRNNEFGLVQQGKEMYLAYETQPLLSVRELPVLGKHYQANALAALALGYGFGLPFDAMLTVLREFKGLPHRCQFVRERQGVRWYNDSKGTNVGATQAAIEGLGREIQGKLVLIAGGLGKCADFSPLVSVVEQYVQQVILIGEAAQEMAVVLRDAVPVSFAASMEEAVSQAAGAAKPHDSVLLSPACASYDMFKNFEHRGDVFMEIVGKLQ